VERSDDGVHDAFHVPRHIRIPNPHDAETLFAQVSLANRIPPRLVIAAVRPAIDLDD
jgi:hypothetical protein